MFKTESHLHTKEVSTCSHCYAKEQVELYHKAGFNTIFVTDHLHSDFLETNSDISKEEAVERFILGYVNAKKEAEKYDMNVILGAEYSFSFGDISNHYLVYGIDEDFLLKNLNSANYTLDMLRKAVKERGAFLIQAHPFRKYCFPTPTMADGMEIYNASPRHFVETDEIRATELAKMYGLYMTSGSDAHRIEDVGRGGMGSEYEIKTAEDYIELIKSGKGIILRG